MIVLTQEQHDELANSEGVSVRVVDPVTNTEYVLMRADDFVKLRGFDSDFEAATESVFKRHEELLRRLA